MNAKHIWTVFRKEVKDIIRDKKTLITSVIAPMIIIPVLLVLVGGGAQKFQQEMQENITIALAENSNTPDIRDLVENRIIKGNPNITLVEEQDPITALHQEKVRLVLEVEKGYAQKMADKKPFAIKLIYDNTKAKSEGSIGIVTGVIENFKREILEERIVALGESPEILNAATIDTVNMPDAKQNGGNPMLMMMLPLLIGMLVVVGGIPAATDLVAGEKERNTFEPLLTTKPSRFSILLGKYFAVVLFSFISLFATLTGMLLGYRISPASLNMGTTGGELTGLNIPGSALVLAILISITLGMAFAGIQIALSTYAKSFKEAQTYLSFLIFAAMIPGYATMFMQPNDIPVYMFFIPILNTISAFKMVLGGVINYTYLTMALGSSVVYVVLALVFAAKMFNNEKYLFRS